MKEIKFSVNRVFYTSISTVILLSVISCPVEFRTLSISNNASAKVTTVFFTASSKKHNSEDSDVGQTRYRVAGRGRNPCSELLIALVPGSGNIKPGDNCNIESIAELARTSSASQPTFWFYIPESTTRNSKLVLIDNNESIAKYSCSLPTNSGIVGVRLPVTDINLEAGNVYQWSFSILKTPRPTENPTVGGKIELDSKESNPWHDRISHLADKLLRPHDSNLESQWSDLLSYAGLDAIATLPLVDYGNCTKN